MSARRRAGGGRQSRTIAGGTRSCWPNRSARSISPGYALFRSALPRLQREQPIFLARAERQMVADIFRAMGEAAAGEQGRDEILADIDRSRRSHRLHPGRQRCRAAKQAGLAGEGVERAVDEAVMAANLERE